MNFANQIHNSELKDSEFRGEATEIDRYIRQVKTDVAAEVDAARRRVDEVHEVQRADPQRIQADDAWANQCQIWQAQTGRRPQWWWRW
jgi:histidinol dehydrogenase